MSITAQATDTRFPPQIKFILGNETCERFSYYGMKSILAVYATTMLAMTHDQATTVIHLFGFANYFMPLIGGWISDRFWGRYKTILWISLMYCAGHGVLAMADLSASIDYKVGCLYLGLALIAVGAGGIKPCVSAFMGDQFKPWQAKLIQRAYAAFYWCINLGSFGAMILIPLIRDHWGWSWAFGVPGILMAIATFVFWLGRKHYVFVEPNRNREHKPGFGEIFGYALTRKGRQPQDGFWEAARRRFSDAAVNDVISTCRVMWVFLLIPPFFALFEQHGSTWVLQGRQMIPWQITEKITFGAEQMQAANPAMVMLLIPFVAFAVYPLFGRFGTPLRRMSVGMFTAGIAYLVVGWLQFRLEQQETLSLAWQLLPYLIMTLSEVLVSVTGLEFAYTQAPKTMKSTITSFWLLTIATGQLLIVLITQVAGSASDAAASVSSERFFLYAGLMLVTAVLFAVAVSFYKYRQVEEAR